MKHSLNRQCLQCHKTLHGRIDKKFCDDYCRNTYNNQAAEKDNELVKHINAILKRNRKLLKECIKDGEETGQLSRQKLQDAGFNFQYFTHQYTTRKGVVYAFVYEFGYLPIEPDRILVVKREA